MIKLIKRMQRRDWFCVAISFVFIVVQIWLDMTMPQYVSQNAMLLLSFDNKKSGPPTGLPGCR